MFSQCMSILFPTNTFHKDFNIHSWSLSGLVVSQELSKWGFSNPVITSLLAAILHERIHPSTTAHKLQFLLKLHTGCVHPPRIWEFQPSSACSVTRTGKLSWKEFTILCFIGHVVFVANSQLCHRMEAATDPQGALATPLQHSSRENPRDWGAWGSAGHGVAQSRTRLSDFTFTLHFHALEKAMATPFRVEHDWSDLAHDEKGFCRCNQAKGLEMED